MKIDWDAREDKNKNKSKQYDIELRPHHILTYPNYANPDTNYSAEFRKVKGNFHSDKLVKHWIKIIRSLHENPSLKFKYVRGIDSICKKCEHRKDCSNPKHINYKIVKDADQDKGATSERLKLALESKKAKEREALFQPLRRLSSDSCLNTTYGDDMLMNAAFLVDMVWEKEFDREVDELVVQHGDRIEFKYIGPAPPYSFVNLLVE